MAQPLTELEKSILRIVFYADIYDYPLRIDELYHGLFDSSATKETIVSILNNGSICNEFLSTSKDYVFRQGRNELVSLRDQRQSITDKLLSENRKWINWICSFPFVRMVAISGATCFGNCVPEDDIDLLVITAPKKVWLLNFIFSIMARIYPSLYHRPYPLCVNYLIAEPNLQIPEQDLFTAHQIVHLKPIYGYPVFQSFIKQNAWIQTFFPNFSLSLAEANPTLKSNIPQKKNAEWFLNWLLNPVVESLVFHFTQYKMKYHPRRREIPHTLVPLQGAWMTNRALSVPESGLCMEPFRIKKHRERNHIIAINQFQLNLNKYCPELLN